MHRLAGIGLGIACFVASAGAQFPARNIELLSHLPLADIGGSGGNDIWGWTDPVTGDEYALFGRQNGTSFIRVTDPANPVYLGDLPTRTGTSVWRDIKVYANHAYVVSDDNGPHGVQIFDLTRLRNRSTPRTWNEDGVYTGVRSAHNITINEQTGFAYVTDGRILNLSDPENLVQVGTVAPNAHDSQSAVYHGPDTTYLDKEVLFVAYNSTFRIYDVSDKSSPVQLSSSTYDNAGYIHQGWLSEDHQFFFVNDETDHKWTHVYDVSSLTEPRYLGNIRRTANSVDHNLYVKDNLIFAANYESGLRVFDIHDAATVDLREIAYLDTFPLRDTIGFNGAWSVYPFFASGTIIVSDIQNGLFVARLDIMDIDFNDDGATDCTDIDALTAAILGGEFAAAFDLNEDGVLDRADRDAWLTEAGAIAFLPDHPYIDGDANLDGVVDISDFNIWNGNKFLQTTSWCDGDFNLDGLVDASDFNIWNAHKFQQAFPPLPTPEPTGGWASILACLLATRGRHRQPR